MVEFNYGRPLEEYEEDETEQKAIKKENSEQVEQEVVKEENSVQVEQEVVKEEDSVQVEQEVVKEEDSVQVERVVAEEKPEPTEQVVEKKNNSKNSNIPYKNKDEILELGELAKKSNSYEEFVKNELYA